MNKNKVIPIIISLVCVVAVAVLGSIFVNLGMEWFNLLDKPSQWIPNVVIPIVWTIIYALVALVCYLWIKNTQMPKHIILLFVINGILNVIWCLVFFTFNQTFGGLIFIILNLIAGISLLVNIYLIKKEYAYALMIYPIWLSIATCLNLALWILN